MDFGPISVMPKCICIKVALVCLPAGTKCGCYECSLEDVLTLSLRGIDRRT